MTARRKGHGIILHTLSALPGPYRKSLNGSSTAPTTPPWRSASPWPSDLPPGRRTGYDWYARNQPIGSEELAETMAPYMNYCIEQFGPARCMFESNFPPDKVGHSYNVLFKRLQALIQGLLSRRASRHVP